MEFEKSNTEEGGLEKARVRSVSFSSDSDDVVLKAIRVPREIRKTTKDWKVSRAAFSKTISKATARWRRFEPSLSLSEVIEQLKEERGNVTFGRFTVLSVLFFFFFLYCLAACIECYCVCP